MLAEVRRTIAHEGMFARHEPLWVAVSGGMDSMVLLHALRSLGHECHVVHVDHGLRGAESDGDRRFVEEHCATHGIRFISERVDVVGRAALKGASTQMAARELRYEVFNRLLGAGGPRKLALAHHADDAVETLLMNLMRGTGIAGWASIPPVSGPFVRPLIAVDREAIRRYALQNNIAFREDSSNTDPHYLRNRVRHELLPLMDTIRPGSRRVLAREVEQLRSMKGVVDRAFRGLLGPDEGARRFIPAHAIHASGAPQLFLQWVLAGNGYHPQVIGTMHEAVRAARTGARFLSSSHVVTVEREGLHIGPRTDEPWPEVRIAEDLGTDPTTALMAHYCGPADIHVQVGNTTAWLDADRLDFPLLLRPWRSGDRMRPIGLGGSKLISDILTDAKVPSATRGQHRVLLSGDDIVWLLGHRVAEGYAAAPGTARVLKLTSLA